MGAKASRRATPSSSTLRLLALVSSGSLRISCFPFPSILTWYSLLDGGFEDSTSDPVVVGKLRGSRSSPAAKGPRQRWAQTLTGLTSLSSLSSCASNFFWARRPWGGMRRRRHRRSPRGCPREVSPQVIGHWRAWTYGATCLPQVCGHRPAQARTRPCSLCGRGHGVRHTQTFPSGVAGARHI